MGLYASTPPAKNGYQRLETQKLFSSPPIDAILNLIQTSFPVDMVNPRTQPQPSVRVENFAIQIVFRRTEKPSLSLVRLRRDRTKPSSRLEVCLDLFSNKRVEVDSLAFLEWLLVSELESFFEMDLGRVGYNLQVEYGYYQNDEERLGAHKQLSEDNFAEEILTIILGYAKYMLS